MKMYFAKNISTSISKLHLEIQYFGPEILFPVNSFVVYKELYFRSSCPVVFLRNGVLKICRKFTGEHSCQSAISIKLPCNFIEVALRHGCSPVNLLHIFRSPFPKNTSGRLLLILVSLTNKIKRAFHSFTTTKV